MLAPQIGWSTFGSCDFIRVPAPAARTTTAAGRLTVTWRCSLIGCCVAGRALAPLQSPPVEVRTRPLPARHSQDTVRQQGRRPHARSMTGVTLPSVTTADICVPHLRGG